MNRRLFLRSAIAAGVVSALPPDRAFAALTEIDGDIAAVTGSGDSLSLEAASLRDLSARLRGNLLLPGGAGHDAARRVLNRSIDKHP